MDRKEIKTRDNKAKKSKSKIFPNKNKKEQRRFSTHFWNRKYKQTNKMILISYENSAIKIIQGLTHPALIPWLVRRLGG